MKNSRISYRKERTCQEWKIIVAIQQAFKNNKILQGSFLTISNALKQFPVLNVSYLKLMRSKLKMLRSIEKGIDK